MYAHNTEENKY